MRLLSLTLEHFRNYQTLELDFAEDQNTSVLLGENATGKTNVLEAITVLSLLKSPRKANDGDLMNWGNTHYRVQGIVRTDAGEEKALEVVSQSEPRKSRASFVNGVKKRASEYIGQLPLISFAPEDLTLFTGPPQQRRKLIDDLLCQVSASYSQALTEYEKTLKQRGALLRQIKEGIERPESLSTWDEKLATLGSMITVDRLQLIETLNLTIVRELKALGENPQTAEFSYVRKTLSSKENDIRNELCAELLARRERDALTLTTSVGPHRDDWSLNVDGRDIVSFASRGQQRAALLALLLLQSSFLELRTGEKPILILDDIFSEFDEKHREAVLTTFAGHQVIMSAVEIDTKLREQTKVLVCPL